MNPSKQPSIGSRKELRPIHMKSRIASTKNPSSAELDDLSDKGAHLRDRSFDLLPIPQSRQSDAASCSDMHF